MEEILVGKFSIKTGFGRYRSKADETLLKETQEINKDTATRIEKLKNKFNQDIMDGESEWFLCLTQNKTTCEDDDDGQ